MAYEIKKQYLENPELFEGTGKSIYEPDDDDDMPEGIQFQNQTQQGQPNDKAKAKEEEAAETDITKMPFL